MAEPRARQARPGRPLAHALEGITVLGLGNFLAGPFGPMLLGDLGATVYKLESPEGDQMRPITFPFNGCRHAKIDVCADLKTPEGREIAHRLVSCGLEHELGGEGNPPVWYRFGMCDQACAFQSAVAVLMVLYWCEGQGPFVDTSIVGYSPAEIDDLRRRGGTTWSS